MTVTPRAMLAGLLPVVISGGRPALRQRHTHRFLSALHGVTADPVWIVRADEAAEYERDSHEIVTYSRDWAYEYARAHWTAMMPLEDGGFHGCCAGRETGCLTAEERGYWGVLMLDDNITRLTVYNTNAFSRRLAERHGGMGMFADVLAAVTLSTNGRMTGAAMSATNPNGNEMKIAARKGFPYSLFVERVGADREHWFGPVEADIIHAYQYGTRSQPGTAVVVPALRYMKDHSGGGGMRAKNGYYTHVRSVALQRMFPETAKLSIRATKSNGRGGPRVFHTMTRQAIRNPLAVTDHALYAEVTAYLQGVADEWAAELRTAMKEKIDRRAAKHEPLARAG